MPTRKDTAAGRFYTDETWGRSALTGTHLWPSVTHILQAGGKGGALINWAANTERALCLSTALEFYRDLAKLPKPLDDASFIAQFEARLTRTKAHTRESDKAKEIGSQAHQLIERATCKAMGKPVGPEPKVREEALWAFMAWEDWFRAHHVAPLLIESPIHHPRLGYAGTLDLLATVTSCGDAPCCLTPKGTSRVEVVDYKSSKNIYGEAHLQVAAYEDALLACGHFRPEGGRILRLPKLVTDPAFETVACGNRLELMPVFRALCRFWVWWFKEQEASRLAYEATRAAKKAKVA